MLRKVCLYPLFLLVISVPATGVVAFAQQVPAEQAPAQTSPPATAPTGLPAATSNDRMFDLIPNFLTLENADSAPPMKSGEKFKAVSKGAFDWGQFVWYGILSGLSQAENSEPGFHQGAEGYGKRYAAYFADGTIENFMVGAVMPSILHQDPRYFQKGKGKFVNRLGYAVSRIVVTRGDSGNAQFNYSEILGSAIASGISTYSYHPHADRTVANTLSVWGTQVSYDALSYSFKEFWPDIRKKLHLK